MLSAIVNGNQSDAFFSMFCFAQEQDLRQVFEPFGLVDYITLQKDPSGRSQGYGFVQCVPILLGSSSSSCNC